ncbi:MAG TPA: hypothetical protein VK212_07945 [Lentimicrobium sp.]|nr:hypothetical protein [Lentimicrobium sp.]
MKLLGFSIITATIIVLSGCANTTRFPVSSVAPAADIKAKTRLDKNSNKVVTVNAKNLASPERIDPSSTAYVIWGKSDESEDIRNLGQLQNKNAETATLTTITPLDIDEIIITAEPSGNVTEPSGTEISRVELIDPFNEEPLPPVDDTYSTPPANTDDPFAPTPTTPPAADTTGMN